MFFWNCNNHLYLWQPFFSWSVLSSPVTVERRSSKPKEKKCPNCIGNHIVYCCMNLRWCAEEGAESCCFYTAWKSVKLIFARFLKSFAKEWLHQSLCLWFIFLWEASFNITINRIFGLVEQDFYRNHGPWNSNLRNISDVGTGSTCCLKQLFCHSETPQCFLAPV